MGLFDILGVAAELPSKLVVGAAKVVKDLDEATLDTGVGEVVHDVADATVGTVGRSVREVIEDLPD